MTAGFHRFRLGDFACVALDDGNFNYPLESFFAGVPGQSLEPVLRARGVPTDHIATPYTCLFVDTGAHRVMIDTGAGALGANAARFFPSVDDSTTETGRILRSLDAAGVDPDDVDTVVVTHAHPDHVGGTRREDGTLVFARARYLVMRAEWEFWMSEAAERSGVAAMVPVARNALEPMRGRVELIDDGAEIVPGIRAVAAAGHTPGHMAVSVRSSGDHLLHVADTALHPLHLENPAWAPVFDIDSAQAAASKRRIMDLAADEGALVFAHHFAPFPSLGRVERSGDGWSWHPLPLPKPRQA